MALTHKLAVHDPYAPQGGAGVIQREFLSVIGKAVGENVSVSRLHTGADGHGPGLYWRRFKKAWQLAGTVADASIIIVQGMFDPGALLVGYLARRHRRPYIAVPRGDYVPTSGYWGVTRNATLKWATWLLFGRAHIAGACQVVATSELERGRLAAIGARADHICVIPDPVYMGPPAESSGKNVRSEKWATVSERPYALWLGRFAREKGLLFLLDCWSRIAERNPAAALLLVGPAFHRGEYNRVVERIEQLGLGSSVFIADWAEASEKAYLLRNARCLVLPSHYESFGLVVVEALSHGTPVLVSSGTPWAGLDPALGECLVRDVPSWTASLARYLSLPVKPALPATVIERTLSRYSPEQVSLQWAKVLNEQFRSLDSARNGGSRAN